jgi:hypothetical protein
MTFIDMPIYHSMHTINTPYVSHRLGHVGVKKFCPNTKPMLYGLFTLGRASNIQPLPISGKAYVDLLGA